MILNEDDVPFQCWPHVEAMFHFNGGRMSKPDFLKNLVWRKIHEKWCQNGAFFDNILGSTVHTVFPLIFSPKVPNNCTQQVSRQSARQTPTLSSGG